MAKNNLFEKYIPKRYKVKRILISFNCFSEYIFFKKGKTELKSLCITRRLMFIDICFMKMS